MAHTWLARTSYHTKECELYAIHLLSIVHFPDFPLPKGVEVIEAGEQAALCSIQRSLPRSGLDSYDENRNFAGIDGTSKMSTYLKFGEIHPRTLLKGLGER